MASCQIICEQIIGKNYDQAHNFSLTVLLKSFKEPLAKEVIAEFTPYLESVLDAVRKATETCQAIPLPQTYVLPISQENHATGDGYPGFEQLSHEQKIALIEQVIADDIRPYIEMDGGGIQVINLLEDKELIISYEGNCSSCYSAIGTTLAYIQQMIHAKVSPHITVVPDIDPESFSFN